jgi:hypothetical protein
VPASICMACSSVEDASTLSEVRVVGLYQYIFMSSFPKRTMPLMFPVLRALKEGCSVNFRFTEFSEVRLGRSTSLKMDPGERACETNEVSGSLL